MARAVVIAALAAQLAAAAVSCAPAGSNRASGDSSVNDIDAERQQAGWRPLFDGRTTAGWRGYRSQSVPAGWRVVEGVLTKTEPVADIITQDQFDQFQLAFDWKLSGGGNSGAFYHGTEEYDHVYWSAPEYQLLDDARHEDGKSRLTSAGAAYALYPSPAGIVRPADEWNSSRIVVEGNRVEHWLNGQMLLRYELGSADWNAKVQASKFQAYPNFGRARKGHIAFQGDHDGTLSLRNIRILEPR